jgi:predicted PurR-regulated permease PerM
MTPKTRRSLILAAPVLGALVLIVVLMVLAPAVMGMAGVALLLVYLLSPSVAWLQTKGVPRWIGSFIALFFSFVALLGVTFVLVPLIIGEIRIFFEEAPRYLTSLKDYFIFLGDRVGLDLPDDSEELAGLIAERAKDYVPQTAKSIAGLISSVFQSTVRLVAVVFLVILVPIFSYYLLVVLTDVKRQLLDYVPPYIRDPVLVKLGEIDRVLSGFIRGQIIVSLILAVLYSLGFVLVGIDLAIVIGTMGGLLFIIPYFGTWLALILATIMAIVKFGDFLHPLYIWGWVAIVQAFEGYILTPRIVGGAVGLHPIIYIFAMIIGGSLFGFVGLLAAVPVTAIAKVFLVSGLEAYRRSHLYSDDPGFQTTKQTALACDSGRESNHSGKQSSTD